MAEAPRFHQPEIVSSVIGFREPHHFRSGSHGVLLVPFIGIREYPQLGKIYTSEGQLGVKEVRIYEIGKPRQLFIGTNGHTQGITVTAHQGEFSVVTPPSVLQSPIIYTEQGIQIPGDDDEPVDYHFGDFPKEFLQCLMVHRANREMAEGKWDLVID